MTVLLLGASVHATASGEQQRVKDSIHILELSMLPLDVSTPKLAIMWSTQPRSDRHTLDMRCKRPELNLSMDDFAVL